MRPGDKILLSGPIGDHGITILLARGELDLEADLRSDTRSVLPLVEALVQAAGPGIRWMRDPTRGGVATSLNELARDCGLWMVLLEEQIPVRDTVRGACELLGLDPLHIANEGQFLAVVSPEYADAAINALSLAPGGERSADDRRSSRTAGRRGAGDHPLRRQPDCRYAGRRSVAANLLDTHWSGYRHGNRLQTRELKLKSDCSSGIRLFEHFFSREAPRLAEACREMSERFLRGGRLLAFGRGPYATDAQHVSVEFVHPVIVGKRALPALDLSILFRPWLEAILHPEDIVMGFGPPEGDPEVLGHAASMPTARSA